MGVALYLFSINGNEEEKKFVDVNITKGNKSVGDFFIIPDGRKVCKVGTILVNSGNVGISDFNVTK